jgi:hypothetical protein
MIPRKVVKISEHRVYTCPFDTNPGLPAVTYLTSVYDVYHDHSPVHATAQNLILREGTTAGLPLASYPQAAR